MSEWRSPVTLGSVGEVKLIELLSSDTAEGRVSVIAALGDVRGELGGTVLRRIATDAAAMEGERCAALVSLTKRDGVEASDVAAGCLADENAAVRRYALRCLAVAGDGRSRGGVSELLDAILSGPPPKFAGALNPAMLSAQSEAIPAVVYLLRHCATANQTGLLAKKVSAGWGKLYKAEQVWLKAAWPACSPDVQGEMATLRPDLTGMIRFVMRPLFAPLP